MPNLLDAPEDFELSLQLLFLSCRSLSHIRHLLRLPISLPDGLGAGLMRPTKRVLKGSPLALASFEQVDFARKRHYTDTASTSD